MPRTFPGLEQLHDAEATRFTSFHEQLTEILQAYAVFRPEVGYVSIIIRALLWCVSVCRCVYAYVRACVCVRAHVCVLVKCESVRVCVVILLCVV